MRHFLEALGRRKHGGQSGRLSCIELGRTLAEVVPGGGFGTEHALAPFHIVEVDLKNALLAQHQLQQLRQHQLLALAQKVALARQQQVLGQLLGDGGAAIDLGGLAVVSGGSGLGFGIALPGLLNSIPFHAMMLHEAGVFGSNHRTLEVAGDLVVVHPLLAPAQALAAVRKLPGFGALIAGGVRIQPGHDCDACHKKQLQQQGGAKHQQ